MGVIGLSYWLESDTFADDEVWVALAEKGGSRYGGPLYDTLKASYCDLMAKASHGRKDGYVTASTALRYCRGKKRVLELLCLSVLGESPRLHRRTDECKCLAGDWVDGYEYRLHNFLKRNPSRTERERNDAMRADRKDARLRALVYERDGGCCRYCRSGPLPPNGGRSKDRRKVRSFDHVDPEKPAGPNGEGYVVACDRCNTEKGHRLPHEADMVLLPEPTPIQRVAWIGQELTLHDRPDPASVPVEDRAEIAPETRRDRVSDRDPDANADRDPDAITEPIDDDLTTAQLRPEQAEGGSRPLPPRSGNPPGSGRGAGDGVQLPAASPPRQPLRPEPLRRSSAHPDIYTRRSRPAPAFPEETWPPGAQPPDWPPGSAVLGALPDPTAQMEDPWTG